MVNNSTSINTTSKSLSPETINHQHYSIMISSIHDYCDNLFIFVEANKFSWLVICYFFLLARPGIQCGFVTRQVSSVEEEMLTLVVHPSSPLFKRDSCCSIFSFRCSAFSSILGIFFNLFSSNYCIICFSSNYVSDYLFCLFKLFVFWVQYSLYSQYIGFIQIIECQ
jgi:hypothetical protein